MNQKMIMPRNIMVFDVESVGLHGEGFAVGYVVMSDGQEVESGFFRCDPAVANGTLMDHLWVKANVCPAIKVPVACHYYDNLGSPCPRHVRDLFWSRWEKWNNEGSALLAADVPWPVESRFLSDCIHDVSARAEFGPYPIIDVASVRFAAGIDPLDGPIRCGEDIPAHHPLGDARQSARLLEEAMNVRR